MCVSGARGGQKRADLLELLAVVNTTWVLRIKPQPSTGAARALNCYATSPVPPELCSNLRLQ